MRKVIAIFGMPRSGTSYVGQIIDSSKDVAYRLEPIFSFRLKNMVDEKSTRKEFEHFFELAYDAFDDEFMNQLDKRKSGLYPTFDKSNPSVLAFKTTRFHQILPSLLELFSEDELKVVCVVRHPAGAISSWLRNPREFPHDIDYRSSREWRTGSCRKTAKEEFWGFDDWLAVTSAHIDLESRYSNFKLFQYEDIVINSQQKVKEIFDFCGLSFEQQTIQFLKDSQSNSIDDPYAVFKNRSVINQWKSKLDIEIQNEIIRDVKQSKLERFLFDPD